METGARARGLAGWARRHALGDGVSGRWVARASLIASFHASLAHPAHFTARHSSLVTRHFLTASFSAVLSGASNSAIRRLPFPAVRGSRFAGHESRFTSHEPRRTRHCPNQSLAKHNRKPSQLIENNHQRPKSIASFCRHFAGLTPPPCPGSPYFYSIQMSLFSLSQLRNSFARRAQADAADHARHESRITSHKSLRDDRACRGALSGGESLYEK